MGHAAAQGDATSAVAIDAVHLLAMSLWVGEVLIAGFVTLPGPWPAAVDSPACAARVRSLSATATWALAGVVCTGGLSALRVIGSVANLTGNGYADVLLVKLTGVGMAVGLGAFNRWRVMPSLLRALSGSGDAAGPMRRFVLILRLEALILFGVVAAAAVLSLSAPPSH
jgi:putative copper resistance protein D